MDRDARQIFARTMQDMVRFQIMKRWKNLRNGEVLVVGQGLDYTPEQIREWLTEFLKNFDGPIFVLHDVEGKVGVSFYADSKDLYVNSWMPELLKDLLYPNRKIPTNAPNTPSNPFTSH